jgi:hypothetical protein
VEEDVQANNAKRNDKGGMKYVCYAEREAQNYAEHSCPGEGVSKYAVRTRVKHWLWLHNEVSQKDAPSTLRNRW